MDFRLSSHGPKIHVDAALLVSASLGWSCIRRQEPWTPRPKIRVSLIIYICSMHHCMLHVNIIQHIEIWIDSISGSVHYQGSMLSLLWPLGPGKRMAPACQSNLQPIKSTTVRGCNDTFVSYSRPRVGGDHSCLLGSTDATVPCSQAPAATRLLTAITASVTGLNGL